MRHSSLLPIALLASASLVEAQTNVAPSVRRGVASSLATGLSDRPEDRFIGGIQLPERVLIKPPLDQSTPPSPWASLSTPAAPLYDLNLMFPGKVADIEIDAQSIGQDLIPPLNNAGVPNLAGAMSWMGVVVSYDNDAEGEPGSNLQRRLGAPAGVRNTPGADLHSYYLEGSQGIDQSLVGRTMVEITSEALGYGPQASDDPDGLDFGMGVLHHGQVTSTQLFFTGSNYFFFSLSPDSAERLNGTDPLNLQPFAETTAGAGISVPAHPATIYRLEWDNGAWSAPLEFRTYTTLGLDPEDDVDALAVHPANASGQGVIVFSTQLVDGRNQLLAHDPLQGQLVLRDASGDTVAKRLGGVEDKDNIDAVCILDPHIGDFDSHIGVPADWVDVVGTGQPLGISVTRHATPVGDRGLAQVTGGGWAPAGSTMTLFFSWNAHLHPGVAGFPVVWVPVGSVSHGNGDDVAEFVDLLFSSSSATGSFAAVLTDASGNWLATSWTSSFVMN